MTWKEYLLILLTVLLIQVLANVGWTVVIVQRYPAMTTYVDQISKGMTEQVNKILQQFDERLRRLEPQQAPVQVPPRK